MEKSSKQTVLAVYRLCIRRQNVFLTPELLVVANSISHACELYEKFGNGDPIIKCEKLDTPLLATVS